MGRSINDMTKGAFEFWLDALLLVAFLLLLSPRVTGLPVHEWAGIVFCVPVLVHLLLSWTWIGTTTKRVFSTDDRRARVNYCLNITLFVLIAIEIVSGLVISQVALPFLGVSTINDRSWRALHNQTLNVTHVAVGLHVAMNWQWIVAALRGPSRVREMAVRGGLRLAPSLRHAVGRSALVLLGAGVVAAGSFALLGRPSEARRYHQNEVLRFAPTPAHGLGQFAGEAALLAGIVYVGRRWLRVRI